MPLMKFIDLETGEEREEEAPAFTAPIPSEVTPHQARVALLNAGLLDQVETLMADPNTPKAAKIAWDYAIAFERHSPFIATLGAALGLSETDIDNLFIAAAQVI